MMIRKMFFLPVLMYFFSLYSCGALASEPGSSSSGNSSSSSSAAVPENVVFTFKPQFDSLGGSGIKNVYLCGSFNSWSETNKPMIYNQADKTYILTNSLMNGSYQYKYRVLLSNNQAIWFADMKTSSAVSDNFGGLNSFITVPYLQSSNAWFGGTVSNFNGMVVYWMNSGFNWQYCDIYNAAGHGKYSNQVAVSTSRSYEIDMYSDSLFTDLAVNEFHRNYYFAGSVTADTTVPSIDMLYTNSGLQALVTDVSNIGFLWYTPYNNGGISNTTIYIESTNSTGYAVISNVNADNQAYTFSGHSNITAGKWYYYTIRFTFTNGWNVFTKSLLFQIP